MLVLEVQARAALPVIESCAAMGLRVVAASSRRLCSGFFSRHVSQRLRYSDPKEYPQEAIDAILEFLSQNQVEVIFPVGDLMTHLVAKRQDEFRRHTALALPPYEVFRQGRSKVLTLQAAQRAGCPIPRTWYPSEQPLRTLLPRLRTRCSSSLTSASGRAASRSVVPLGNCLIRSAR